MEEYIVETKETEQQMTKRQAKDLSLEVWQYLMEHPEIDNKGQLPSKLYKKISRLRAHCPLCEVFKQDCSGCPLGYCGIYSAFDSWTSSMTPEARRACATKIYLTIKEWKV